MKTLFHEVGHVMLGHVDEATLRIPNVHHGISGRWKQRPFPCCAVSLLVCQERSTAVVTSNHEAKARHSPSGPPNASSMPQTKPFAQAIRASEVHKKTLANLQLASRLEFLRLAESGYSAAFTLMFQQVHALGYGLEPST
ncbi:MAG: hypothetical protein AUI53_06805 [Acidobacteria bacterium 13_1_40CM_2_60_7]|nr:MAG: hypothetical protein AUI53_06805 [Acidobacteria bacterium 13_1_40CM_2_60_7]